MSRLSVGRAVAGALAFVGLVFIGYQSMDPGVVRGPAVVDASATWKVVSTGDGRYRWTLEEGRTPLGHAVVGEGILQSERGDPVQLALLDGLTPGAKVRDGQAVARLVSSVASEQVATLEAEAAAMKADLALLEAGGRPETVAAAARAVDVAEANLALAVAQAEQLAKLARDGAVSEFQAQEARRLQEVRQAELSLAKAQLAEARLPARPEEAQALEARVAALDARLQAAKKRNDQQVLTVPIEGELSMPGGEVALQVHAAGNRVVRIAVDETSRSFVSEGNPVTFTPTADPDALYKGEVLAVADAARSFRGRTVVWVVAELAGEVPVGSTGAAAISRSN